MTPETQTPQVILRVLIAALTLLLLILHFIGRPIPDGFSSPAPLGYPPIIVAHTNRNR